MSARGRAIKRAQVRRDQLVTGWGTGGVRVRDGRTESIGDAHARIVVGGLTIATGHLAEWREDRRG